MVVLDEIINRYFSQERLAHAYLLETRDFDKVLTIIKKIVAASTTQENADYLIDNGMYSDLKIIEPDGQWIKKEQVAMLKSDFKVKSIYGNKRIYVIKNAENLNKSSANTMLKFLEEPEENIIALLVTTNKNKVIDTLVSRCQYILLDSNREQVYSSNEEALKIFSILESKRQNASLEVFKIFDEYEDRNQIRAMLNDLILLYEQALLKKLDISSDITYNEVFDKLINNHKIEDIKKRINGLILIVDALEYNVNLKLMMDKLVISMFGVD